MSTLASRYDTMMSPCCSIWCSVCCSVLQCVAVVSIHLLVDIRRWYLPVVVCVAECGAVCCSVLQWYQYSCWKAERPNTPELGSAECICNTHCYMHLQHTRLNGSARHTAECICPSIITRPRYVCCSTYQDNASAPLGASGLSHTRQTRAI